MAVARAVARATATRTVARASPRAVAKAKGRVKVDEEALTTSLKRTTTLTSSEGTLIPHQGRPQSHLVGCRIRGLRPVPRRKPNENKRLSVPAKMKTYLTTRKLSSFMTMAQKLQKKGFQVTCPTEF